MFSTRLCTPLTGLTAGVLFIATAIDGSTHYLAAYALRLAVLGWLLTVPRERAPVRLTAVAVTFITLSFALGLLSSERMVAANEFFANAAIGCAVLWVASTAPRRWIRETSKGVIVAAAGHAIWALIDAALDGGRARAGFFNPNNLGAWLVVAIAFVLSLTARARPFDAVRTLNRRDQIGIVALLVVLVVGVIATASRSAAIALVATCAPPLVLAFPRRALVGLVASPLAIAWVPALRQRFLGSADAFAYDRLAIWSSAWQVIRENPFGVGLGDVPHALRVAGVTVTHGPVRYPKVALQAHNEALQLAMELGFGGVLVVAALAMLVCVALRKRDRGSRGGLWVSVVAAVVIPAAFGATLRVPVITLSAALLVGQYLPRGSLRQRGFRWPLALATLALFVVTPAVVSRALSAMADTAQHRGNLQKAEALSGVAITVAPFDLSARLLHASLRYRRSRDGGAALTQLESLAKRFPMAPEPPERAITVLRQAPPSPARNRLIADTLRERTRRDPKNARLWVERAHFALQRGQPSAAQRSLNRALLLEPNCADALALTALGAPPGPGRQRTIDRALHADHLAARYNGKSGAILALDASLREQLQALRYDDSEGRP